MRHCPKCGKEVQDSWKFCLGCGAEVPADAPPVAVRADGIAAPPVMRPPEASATPAARYELEIPRYQGGPTSPAKPGAKPALLIAILAAVALLGAVGFFLMSGKSSRESSAQGQAQPVQVQPIPGSAPAPAAAPAEPPGVVDRALLEAERQLGQAGQDLKRELREEWEAANTEPDPAAGRPTTPDRSVVRDRFAALRETIYACAAGRDGTIKVSATFEGASGRVTEATVEGDFPAEAKECVAETVRGVTLPPFTQESLNVEFPYVIGSE